MVKDANISRERLKAVPEQPGVYLMKAADGEVIYVGKAKMLRSRVRSYFSGGDERHSVQFLLDRIRSLETIVTEDERQALLLEADLIRKYKPRYNIRLKDDKAYLLVRVNWETEWPRLELVRSEEEDGAQYIGPFPFGYELRTMLELIKRAVPLRTCTDHTLRNRVRPCIEYQIKRCSGPCCLPVDREEYLHWVKQAIEMLQGKNSVVAEELQTEMERASEELRFEDAADIRDRLEVLERFKADNTQVLFGDSSQDAFGIYREGARVEVSLLMVRRGRLFESKSFGFDQAASPDEEIIGSILSQYYGAGPEIPQDVLLPIDTGDIDVRAELLSERRGKKVNLLVPKIGAKARLLALALSNAKENFQARFSEQDFSDVISRALAEELQLEEVPRVIECVDVSHFQGGSTVASVVSFKDGKPDKTRYRHFILTQEGKPDDFASMREVVTRHLSRGAEENTLPDLLVVDGGPAQLSQAIGVQKELGLQRPYIVGLAKKRIDRVPYRAHQKTLERARSRRPERIFRDKEKEPLVLPPESEALHLLERLRDEAHRFAISFHRKRRSKKVFESALENIQGVGPKRRKELLKTFGSIKGIENADPEDISSRCNVPIALSKRIVETLARRRKKQSS